MRINDIAQNIIANQSGSRGIVHGMNKRTNSYGQTGMYVNGTTSADRKIVKVSDDITEKVINLARSEFLNNFGVTDGEEFNAMRAKYVSATPESERLNVAWTLGKLFSMNLNA